MESSFVLILNYSKGIASHSVFYLIKTQAETHHYKANVRLCLFPGLKQGEVKLDLSCLLLRQKLHFLQKYQIIEISQYALVRLGNLYFNQSCRISWESFAVHRRKKGGGFQHPLLLHVLCVMYDQCKLLLCNKRIAWVVQLEEFLLILVQAHKQTRWAGWIGFPRLFA